MKKMKKILCLCLALAMCLSLVNLTALAVENECPSNPGYSHEYVDGICKYCGDGAVCSHPNRKEELTESTCTSAGHKKIFCPDCGAVLQDEECPKLEHLYLEGKCKYCGQDEPKAECEHYHTETVIVGGPICTEPEYKVTKCKDCGEELSKEQCPFPGKHEYDDGKCKYCGQDEPKAEHTHTLEHCGGTPATCELTGMKESWFCTECGEHFLDQDGTKSASKDDLTIPALEPVFGEWKNNGDGTQTRVCKNCNGKVEGHSETESIGHTHTLEYCKGTPATCELTGMKESWFCTECGEHFLDQDGTQSATKEDLTIPALEPVFDGAKWVPLDSLKHIRYCVNCDGKGELHEETGAHNFNDWYTSKEATCTEDGLKVRECKDCGYKEEQVIPALGHDLKWCEGEEQSCFAAGRRGYWYCERCNKGFLGDDGTGEFTDKDLLAIPGMDADYNGQQWEPYSDTQHKMVCKNCNGVADKHTEYAPHTWGEWHAVEGSTTQHVRECEDCGAKQEAEHRMGDWVIDKAATVEEEGSQHRDCADCEYTEYETIAKLVDENSGGNNGGNNNGGDNNNNNGGNNNGGDDDTDIPDENPPLTDLPDEETPTVETPTEETPVPVVDLPDEDPPLTDIPDEETPTVETPTEETPIPVVDLPDEQPPLVDLPDEQMPLTDVPMEQPPLAEQVEVNIPDDPTPLANVPQTGDYSPVWFATLLLSAMGLAVLTLKKREGEEN